MCCVFFFVCVCKNSLSSAEFIRFWLLSSPLIPDWFVVFGCGGCLRPYVFETLNLGLCFILQQNFYSVLWLIHFINHQWHLCFHPTGMSPTGKSVSEWLRLGLWLVIDGASTTHTLSAQLLSMHGLTWWLISPWRFLQNSSQFCRAEAVEEKREEGEDNLCAYWRYTSIPHS